MHKIRLFDPRSGLHMDREVKYLGARVVLQQFDNKFLYDFEYEPVKELYDGAILCKFRKKSKRRLDW